MRCVFTVISFVESLCEMRVHDYFIRGIIVRCVSTVISLMESLCEMCVHGYFIDGIPV